METIRLRRHPSIILGHLLRKPHQMAVTFSVYDPLETLMGDIQPGNLMRNTPSLAYRFTVTLKFGAHEL